MSDFIFRINPNIILGPYTVSRLGQQVREWGSRFMVIVDPFLNEAKRAVPKLCDSTKVSPE